MIWPFRKRLGRASKIAIKPPAPASDRQGLCLVVIAKNEGARLHDWLSFHALAGVSHVILYDNMSTDDTARIARDFKGMPVTVVPWQLHTQTVRPAMVLPRQILAYCHALSTFGGQFRWMSMIDVDEFIVPRDHATIPEALATLDRFTNISLPWIMFGHNGHETAPADPVPFSYTQKARQATGALLNFKCIVDPCDVTQVSVHKFETRQMGATSANTAGRTAGNKQRGADFVTDTLLQLNHYYLMSRAETEAKMSGGGVSGVPLDKRAAAIGEKAALIEADTVPDTTAPDFLARHGIMDGAALRARYKD